jgi:hypothetical protein
MDRNVRAPELSRTVGTAGALDINGQAAGNDVGLSSRDKNICSVDTVFWKIGQKG